MRRALILFGASLALVSWPLAAQRYSGPQPPKPDVPYLVHADNLVEPDIDEAKEESRKDDTIYSIAGATARARTPLAEPMFLMRAEKLAPERMQVYQLDVKSGRREITIHKKVRKDSRRPKLVNVTRVADGLYRIEASETFDNGEYCLTPEGSNQVFCFTVY